MKKQHSKDDTETLLEIMARLRGRTEGSAWDLAQTFESVAPHTLEEAYEVVDAIERKDLGALKDELGDLLLQVVYHSRIAEEMGVFDFSDVAEAICAKMIRRHPQILDKSKVLIPEAKEQDWEVLKDCERSLNSEGVLSSIPRGLPGLTRGIKLGRRAARVGFDWSETSQVREKVGEELAELDEAIASGDRTAIAAEMGDLLLSLANFSRHLALDPESCIRGANSRFECRFKRVEDKVKAKGGQWDAHDAASLERFWQQAKTES